MEIFFNLLWAAIAAMLFGAWFASVRHNRHSILPSIELQLITLAMLALILLPVISLTDDLQANTNPAETEHFSRRSDVHPSLDRQPHSLPLAVLVATQAVAQPVVIGSSGPDQPVFSRIDNRSPVCAKRPPPLVSQLV